MAIAPPLLVPTPTRVPPRGGLLSVADIIPTEDQHWQNGIEYAANPAPGGTADAVSCDPITPAVLAEGVPWVTDLPMRVHTGFTCKHPGLTLEEINAYARGRLAAGESAAVERGVWPTIMTDAVAPGGSGPVSLLSGLGTLEAWLYETYGGLGVLHIARAAIPPLVKAKQVVVGSGGALSTVLGTKISAGVYPSTGPDEEAPAAGTTWIAVSAAVQVRRSETRVRTQDGGYFDHRDNTVIGTADRIYVVGWEHLAATALITLEP